MSNGNVTPVIMYPEGVKVGRVRSGKSSSGVTLHIAYNDDGARLGSFDRFREAQDAVLANARKRHAPVWTPTTPDERRRTEVAALVAETLAKPEGQRYAAAYGTLSALVISEIPGVGTEWAREYVRGLKASM